MEKEIKIKKEKLNEKEIKVNNNNHKNSNNNYNNHKNNHVPKSEVRKSLVTIIVVMLFIGLIIAGIINADIFKSKEVVMDNNIALYVNTETVSRDLFKYYLTKGKEYYEKEGGSDIWEATIDGLTAFEKLKEDICDKIIQVKLQVSKSKELGIVIDDLDYDKLNISFDDKKDNQLDSNMKEVYDEYIKDQLYIIKLKDYYASTFEINEDDYNKYLKDNNIDINLLEGMDDTFIRSEYIKNKSNELYEKDYEIWNKEKIVNLNEKVYTNITLYELGN